MCVLWRRKSSKLTAKAALPAGLGHGPLLLFRLLRNSACTCRERGKLGKQIQQAVQSSGPDPVANSQLQGVLTRAKQASLPRDIIERNIKKATESKADFTEVWRGSCDRGLSCIKAGCVTMQRQWAGHCTDPLVLTTGPVRGLWPWRHGVHRSLPYGA